MKSPKKILVVDDEPKIIEVITSYLQNSGYEAYQAFNGREAMNIFEKVHSDLVILDLMLPDIMGEEICQKLRRISRVPIIMLTAKVDEEAILNGLYLGADDYVTKPFSPRQLMARVEALLRRTTQDTIPLANLLQFRNQDLVIDALKHEVRKGGKVVNLTPHEYKILMAILKYPQKAFTRDEIVNIALGEDFEGFDRTVDTHIKNLRQKIETDPKKPRYILTVHGFGYRFGGD